MIQQLPERHRRQLCVAPLLFEGLDPFCEREPFSKQSAAHRSDTRPPGVYSKAKKYQQALEWRKEALYEANSELVKMNTKAEKHEMRPAHPGGSGAGVRERGERGRPTPRTASILRSLHPRRGARGACVCDCAISFPLRPARAQKRAKMDGAEANAPATSQGQRGRRGPLKA